MLFSLIADASIFQNPALANDDRINQQVISQEIGKPAPRHYEVFAGADAANTVWLIYAGTTLAPFGDIHEDGLRLRFSGGYGQYKYYSRSSLSPFQERQYRATTHFQDALIGYLKRMGPLTTKAFIGVAQIDHQVFPFDHGNIVQGTNFGAKGVLEFWLNMGDHAWGSLDLSWSQAHNTRSARSRVGFKVLPSLSLGLEAAINVDAQAEYKLTDEVLSHRSTTFDFIRVGGFARMDWYGGEISSSAGLLGDFTHNQSPYVTVNWLKQF